MNKTAMILAAGRGERLRPLTDRIAKPMCCIKGLPLIEHHVIHLSNAGFTRIIINHAYLGCQIRQHLGDGSRWGVAIHYSPEPPGGLETGGGIVQALPLLGDTPFITVNADVFTDFDFNRINLESPNQAQLVLIPKNPGLGHHGDYGLTQQMLITNSDRHYTFSGIACYHPQLFSGCHPGRYSVTPLVREYVRLNQVPGLVHDGFWFDIGTAERLKAIDQATLPGYS